MNVPGRLPPQSLRQPGCPPWKGWDPWLCVTGLLQLCLYRSRLCEIFFPGLDAPFSVDARSFPGSRPGTKKPVFQLAEDGCNYGTDNHVRIITLSSAVRPSAQSRRTRNFAAPGYPGFAIIGELENSLGD